jgi:hypothetical protein
MITCFLNRLVYLQLILHLKDGGMGFGLPGSDGLIFPDYLDVATFVEI